MFILHETSKESTKSVESWNSLVNIVASCTVSRMEEEVSNYEELVRNRREQRNENDWSFCQYFLLQVGIC